LAKALVSFDKMGFKDTVKEKLLLENARNLFGLTVQ
jgi:hypothetical protein